MKMTGIIKISKSHYVGLAVLFVLILLLQIIIYFNTNFTDTSTNTLTKEELAWLQTQNEIDSLKEVQQENLNKIYPFNPNFISDYKGYKLGMTVAQIDKLHQFRKLNKYVNSAKEFQNLTGVSNQWLETYSKYFKFPDWVTNRTAKNNFSDYKANFKKFDKKETKITIQDINLASQLELEKVYMIGEKTAQKIIAEREKLGAFVNMQQIEFIWGISPDAIVDLNKKFQVKSINQIKKININNLSIKELQQFPYFNYTIAKNIVTFRSMNGEIKKIDDLSNIKQFPLEKLKIIAVYLEF